MSKPFMYTDICLVRKNMYERLLPKFYLGKDQTGRIWRVKIVGKRLEVFDLYKGKMPFVPVTHLDIMDDRTRDVFLRLCFSQEGNGKGKVMPKENIQSEDKENVKPAINRRLTH